MKEIQKYWQSIHKEVSDATRDVLYEYLLCLKLANKAVATITKYRLILERFFRGCIVPLEFEIPLRFARKNMMK